MSQIKGVYNATAPTIRDGQNSDIQLDVNGNAKVTLSGATGTSATQVQGTAADNAAAVGNPVKVGAKYNASAPTYADGDVADLQADVNGNAKVTQATLLAGEDLTNDVLKVENRYSYATIKTATTTTIKSGAGFVHSISIIGGTLGTVAVYDNTAASGTEIIPSFTPTAALPCPTIILDESFSTGLTIITGAATIINISYR